MTSMNVSLPEEVKEFAEAQTKYGYSTPSEIRTFRELQPAALGCLTRLRATLGQHLPGKFICANCAAIGRKNELHNIGRAIRPARVKLRLRWRGTEGLRKLRSVTSAGVTRCLAGGTLGSEEGPGNVSRITLALVRGDIAKKNVQNGLVISLVVERAALGTASQWLGEFLSENEAAIRRLLAVK